MKGRFYTFDLEKLNLFRLELLDCFHFRHIVVETVRHLCSEMAVQQKAHLVGEQRPLHTRMEPSVQNWVTLESCRITSLEHQWTHDPAVDIRVPFHRPLSFPGRRWWKHLAKEATTIVHPRAIPLENDEHIIVFKSNAGAASVVRIDCRVMLRSISQIASVQTGPADPVTVILGSMCDSIP